ncbi:alpha/beta hydrolase [Streptococcus moroccensis]|uniref:Acetyl esterase/lipase n=1 Tax=Streptococcus moroccensis TaxID=1451356 RepID=A0ABT9YRI7_9STRE|nr:alpha/beta hydrolase [Streptococcus moroccensis]MDQ0222613.1 acetyl esterase/lipase [Streptococcus moroccensis]
MKYIRREIGQRGAYAKYYFQEPNKEIDLNRKYPTIVICPGGAYYWTSFREDEQVAMRFLAEGFHVLVVHYATEGIEAYASDDLAELPKKPVSVFPNPLIELATAVAFLRENSREYSVDEDFIIVSGFSAGGNLAGQLATLWHEDWLEEKVGKKKELYKPTHAMLGYAALDFNLSGKEKESFSKIALATTGSLYGNTEIVEKMNPINHVSDNTPPCFIWHTREDVLVAPNNALRFALELDKHNIPYEVHVFDKGKHGLVLGDLRTGVKESNENAQVYKWVDLFLEWLYPIKTKLGGFYKPIDVKQRS